jgi:N-acetylmuramoyl-L-alanine amidase
MFQRRLWALALLAVCTRAAAQPLSSAPDKASVRGQKGGDGRAKGRPAQRGSRGTRSLLKAIARAAAGQPSKAALEVAAACARASASQDLTRVPEVAAPPASLTSKAGGAAPAGTAQANIGAGRVAAGSSHANAGGCPGGSRLGDASPRKSATAVDENENSPPPLDPAKDAQPAAAGPRSAGASLASQLGIKVHRVVIDPGHGGHDTGAIGHEGTREKDAALAISRRLFELLSASGLEVILTRHDDSFVRLEDRARLANEARGDLFVSIHCNSAPTRRLRGVETYTLNTSGDRYSIRLAARENASSGRSISDLQYILADLATKANTFESAQLASRVQQSLISHLRAKHRGVQDLGTKEALFYVLLGVRMPAILVETSFLSNPEEEKRLSSKSYQGDVAAAIAAGIRDFFGSRQKVAKVD